MTRNLGLYATAVVVVALAAPAVAGAAKLTMPANSLVPNGKRLITTTANASVKTSLGTITCASIETELEVTENNGSEFTAVGIGEGVTSGCKLGTKEASVTNYKLSSISSSGSSGTGTAVLTFNADLPGGIKCHFSATALPFSYSSGESSINLTGADLTASPAACEPGLLAADSTLETRWIDGGGIVIIDA